MKLKIKILIVVVAVIAVGLIINFLSSKKPITDEAQAIAHAKRDLAVKKFIIMWSAMGYEIKSYAKFENNIWIVVFYPKNVYDVAFEMRFAPDGNILKKGEMEGG